VFNFSGAADSSPSLVYRYSSSENGAEIENPTDPNYTVVSAAVEFQFCVSCQKIWS